MYRSDNIKPEDFPDVEEGQKYREWLEKNPPV
jgi:hypothetical protein